MNLRYFLVFILLLGSCASSNIKRQDQEHLAIDPNLKNRLKGTGSIELLSHQLLPIDYLRKNPDIHGLLINHYMGTGKTFLGIGFIQNFADRPILLIAPRFLESQWMEEIKRYGVKDPSRIIFASFDDLPGKLSGIDIKDYVVIADEVHNLMKRIRSNDPQENLRFSQAYLTLRKAYKVIGLTGTPVYGDESDLAYMVNLVSGLDLMPFNQESFRLEYTSLKNARKFLRGYISESNFLTYSLPLFLSMLGGAIIGPWGMPVGAALGVISTVGANAMFDTNTFKFRELNVVKMEPVMSRYISYFKFDDSQFKDFPAQEFKVEQVPYNKYQYSFFLRLVEGDLPVDQLQRLLKDDKIRKTDEEVMLNSSQIHQQIYSTVGTGRDIGNYDFIGKDGKLVEAPKFLAIYEHMMKHDEQTVLYSNYYKTGILAFEKFLKRQKFNRAYGIIDPDMKPDEVRKVVTGYNSGEIKFLMLHPDITEGISLKGTQFLHILEPLLNGTALEQVIGRTRRFQSHSHLAKDKQLVHVTLWQSSSSTWDPDLGQVNRANWFKRYNELSYMSRWGIGITQVDKNYDKKALNPEELSYMKMQTLEVNLKEMQAALTKHSIENLYSKP